ncbi:putative transcription factor interactor and regulator CCHC(Zn) family [Helianthus annuus]|uniref:Transcription factor interactor and regulator CCHC(Zn) family n=1 Tax=Helianthus annuus TaxID=4232 RepID=A0A9K3EK21_HELAN|nr:putative transcription factor interactor and regulator CCHC(Zn) family [Helianthus annuus]KAJ0477789.1 putative transcription factor interactor and regulator CCHC(Zn) family [Helianthus annuus]KAJ0482366.1 putative transcription factor interactor and regulator CCHC(Zn) family [Helianthus annuus]KAJ0498621.1 putative transcription factor interactor and regulator ARID family [Helianthus annuus]KAJ0664635.1 putative transcription factor interactor and regulator CCHC(Zn) family [Helianthus annuu
MKYCESCGSFERDCVCGHNSIRSDWSWVSDDDDTNIGIRAKGLTGTGKGCDNDGNRLRGDKGKSVETDYGENVVRSGKCGRAAEEMNEYAQGKPTIRIGKLPVKKFPKKMVPKGFVKKSGKKANAPVGRPRKPGIRCFKCKQFGHIASICPSKYVNLSPLPVESDYMVKDTCGGKWDSIWFVDPTYKTHMTGNRNVFKCFKRHFGLVINESRKDFSFVHGIGEVRVPVDGKDKTIPCVSYAPSLDKNVLSLEQLLFQGIETVTMGDTCLLKKMFGSRSKGFDIYEDKSEVDLEQDYLNTFYDNLGVDNDYKKEKKEFKECLEEYYEREFEKERNKKKAYGESSRARKREIVYSKKAKKALLIYTEGEKDNPYESKETLRERALILSQLEEDVIERNIIIESCVEPKDLITLHEELKNHQRFFDAPFEEILIWFISDFLGIVCEKAMPPELIDGRELSLILLHRIVKLNGGFKEVMEKNLWDVIAAKYGYEPDDAYEVKVAYIYYLELVEWYFNFMRNEHGKKANVMAGNSNNNGWLEESSDDEVAVKIEVTNNRKE